MTPEELKVRGENAARLLQDKLLNDSLDTIEREIMEQWEACPARDVEGREELWKYYKVAKKFRGILQGMVESGKVAAFHQQQEKTFMQKTVERFTPINRR